MVSIPGYTNKVTSSRRHKLSTQAVGLVFTFYTLVKEWAPFYAGCWLGFHFYGPCTEVIHIDGSMLYLDGWSSREVFFIGVVLQCLERATINLNAQLLYLLQAASCLCESGRTVVKLKKTRIHLNFDLYPAHMRHPTRLSFSNTSWWYVLG